MTTMKITHNQLICNNEVGRLGEAGWQGEGGCRLTPVTSLIVILMTILMIMILIMMTLLIINLMNLWCITIQVVVMVMLVV